MAVFLSNHDFELGVARSSKHGGIGPIHRSHLGMWIMLRGNLLAKVDDRRFKVAKGRAAFLYAHHVHELQYTSNEVEYIWCGSTWDTASEFTVPRETIEQLASIPNVLKPSKLLYKLLRLGVAIQHRRGLAAQRVRNTIGESAFNEYFYLANIAEEESAMPKPVIKSKTYMQENYSTLNCKLNDIADAAALSPQHLTKLFKQYMQCTPVKYLWQLRGEKAIHLLKYSNLNISEITTECGFKDPYHFSRYIRRHYGKSPRDIRKRHWESNSISNGQTSVM